MKTAHATLFLTFIYASGSSEIRCLLVQELMNKHMTIAWMKMFNFSEREWALLSFTVHHISMCVYYIDEIPTPRNYCAAY
jgi:hypothetical protein